MKKAKLANRTAAMRVKSAPRTVDEYFAKAPEPGRARLSTMRAAIRSVVPKEATEIISYRIPAVRYKGVLVWYAAFSNHCSLFPTNSVITAFKTELTNFSTSKGTVQFPHDKPLPTALIRKMVKARIAEVEGKKKA